MKRISKELDQDFKNFTYNCVIYHPNHRGMEINLTIKSHDLVFKLTPNYPFKPPGLFLDSYILTLYPNIANLCEQAKPDGPEPITAIFFPLLSFRV